MPDRHTEMSAVLLAVRQRVIDAIFLATVDNTYISDNPDSFPPSPSDIVYVVSPSPTGTFDAASFAGGGLAHATINTIVLVTIHSIADHDEAGRAQQIFSHPDRGLFNLARPVWWVLSGHELRNTEGELLLDQPIFPGDYNWNRPDRRDNSIQLGFPILFDLVMPDQLP